MVDDNELNAAEQILGGGIVGAADERMAVLNITLKGEAGDLPDLVPFDATDDQVKTWATEAVRGGFKGVDPQEVDFKDFSVVRVEAKDDLPDRLLLRPKTPFGGVGLDVRCKVPVILVPGAPDIRYVEVNAITHPAQGKGAPVAVQVVIGEQTVVVEAESLLKAARNASNV